MTALADRTLRDIVPVLDRYRPAALAATAIIVAVAVLPGASQGTGIASPAAFDAGFVDDEDQDEQHGGSAEAASPAAPAAGGLPTPSAAPAPRVAPAAPAPSFTPSGSSGSSGSDAPSPSPTPPPAGDPVGSGGADEADDEPEALQIAAAAYASTTGGTPLPTEVPEGSLPVGARVDQVDKASYIRLSGSGSTLVLTELADGRRGGEFESAPVQACQITDPGWQSAENMSFADAPAHDPDVCVPASMLPDGRWSIPLTMFADPTDDRGIALVPAPEAPIDFQVTFAATVAG